MGSRSDPPNGSARDPPNGTLSDPLTGREPLWLHWEP